MTKTKSIYLALLALLLSPMVANADPVILGPAQAASSGQDPFQPTWTPGNLIDQSGLCGNYVSGVTDFATFTNSTQARYTACGGSFSTNLAGVDGLGSFYFDLGDVFNVSAIATWGQDGGSATVSLFDLFYSDTFGASGSRVFIGTFGAGFSPNAFVDYFSSVNARYFELDVTVNYGYPTSRMNEVVFGGTVFGGTVSVPEPSTFALLGLGLVGMAARRRKTV